tara:strand:- start:170 stop:1027 length:858 start_codon:yes stop_codon:yes gene_type:complete
MKRSLFYLFFLSIGPYGLCNQIADTIYINQGVLQTFNGSTVAYKAFNRTVNFDKTNAVLTYSTLDTVALTVVNNDMIPHEFSSLGLSLSSGIIVPGSQVNISIHSVQEGTYIFHDAQDYPNNKNLGLAGMIVFKSSSAASFYWNLKELDTIWVNDLSNGVSPSTVYNPKFFLINGNHNPDINTDPLARVIGNVGDTILIHISNTGNASHSIHFHGYHLELVQSSKHPYQEGRNKDTFPIHPMETLTLQMVPHQPGEYPVHDHNLVAVTGANLYPNGMFLTMLINP